jgi:hypothetical protein
MLTTPLHLTKPLLSPTKPLLLSKPLPLRRGFDSSRNSHNAVCRELNL